MTTRDIHTATAEPLPGLPRALALAVGLAAAAGALVAAVDPSRALFGAAAAVVVAVALLRLDVAVLLVVATAPLEASFLGQIGGVSATKAAGALCIASFGLYALRAGRVLYWERSQPVVLGILAIAMLSLLQAYDISAAITTTSRYASFVAIYIVFTQLVGEHVLHRRIAWVLSVTSTIGAAMALNDYFNGRAFVATLPDANPSDFAFVLATTLPLTFWLLGGSARFRPVVLAMLTVISAAIVLSLSRGTLVGLAAGLVFFLFTDRRRFKLVAVGGAVALFAAVVVIRSDPARFEQALVLKEQVAEYNVATRFDAWYAASELAAERPLLGVGPGNFQFHYAETADIPPGAHNPLVAHNAFLDVAAELGMFAMFLFTLYLVMTFARLTQANRIGVGLPGFAQALRVSLVIAITSAIFLSEQYFLPFWLIGGLATALWLELREQDRPAESV